MDADEVASAAVKLLDKDGDGVLSTSELSEVKSLMRSLERLDADGDNQLSQSEISSRIKAWQAYGAGLIGATCTVLQKGQPVPGARITYTPEAFFEDSILEGYGKTNAGGRTIMSVAAEFRPKPIYRGLQTGFYRISVTLADGTEVEDLEEGFEVAGDMINEHTVRLP